MIAFLRLRFSPDSGTAYSYKRNGEIRKKEIIFPELADNTALIRELHVYGEATEVNRQNQNQDSQEDAENKNNRSQQHIGFGTKLLNKAFSMAKEKKCQKIAVISGEGVKNYYRRFGFDDTYNDHFLMRPIAEQD